MNIGSYKGPERCVECGSKGPGLRELEFRAPAALPGADKPRIVLCPGCAPTLQHTLKNEFGRPHLKPARGDVAQNRAQRLLEEDR